jgi:hypothetical protein
MCGMNFILNKNLEESEKVLSNALIWKWAGNYKRIHIALMHALCMHFLIFKYLNN